MRPRLLTFILAWSVAVSSHAFTAREVLERVKTIDDTDRRWTDRTQAMILTVYRAGGIDRRRELTAYGKRYPGDEDKTIVFFHAPADVKGIGFLEWVHQGRGSDQWLYLPELSRTRQISSQGKDESFVGTDFSYRDFEVLAKLFRWSEREAPARFLKEDAVADQPCWVIELRPDQRDVPYSRLAVWVEQARLIPRRLELFVDPNGDAVKRLTLDDVKDVGRIPTPHRLEMVRPDNSSRTVVELTKVAYDSGLADDLFTQRSLERGGP